LNLDFWRWVEPHAWPYKTHATFGFSNDDVYLSSIGRNQHNEPIYRIKNIRGKASGLDLYWITQPEYVNLDGTKLHSEVHHKERFIGVGEICIHECEFERPSGLPDITHMETDATYSINLNDNALITVKQFTVPTEEDPKTTIGVTIDYIAGKIYDQYVDLFNSKFPQNETAMDLDEGEATKASYFNYEEVEKLKKEVASILGNLTLVQEEHIAYANDSLNKSELYMLLVILVAAIVVSGTFVFCAFFRAEKQRVE
jgi:hypothetical protein